MEATSGLLTQFVEIERHSRLYTGGKVQAPFSADFIACVCGAEVNLVDLTTGKVLLTVPSDADEFTAFALREDGRQLVTAGRSRQMRSWKLDITARTCECERVWKAHKMPVMDLAYDPTGTHVASGSADSTAMVFDVDRAVSTHIFRGHEGVVHLVAFHPDPKKLQVR